MLLSVRDQFGKHLAQLANEDSKVLALDGDLGNSTRLDTVEKETKDSFLQMGIAEQNMVGVAAGLASVGLQPLVVFEVLFVVLAWKVVAFTVYSVSLFLFCRFE